MKYAQAFKILSLAVAVAIAMPAPTLLAKEKKKPTNELSALKFNPSDEKGNDVKALKAELLIAHSEEQAIAQVNKLLKKYRNTPLEPDLLLRLGELYIRRAKTDRFLEVHRNSDEIVSFAPKVVRNAASKNQIQKAINVYDDIQRRYPRFDKLDMVVFNNAFANQQMARYDRSEQLFLKLVKEFPDSQLLPDGHLALGEICYGRQQFSKALVHFEAVRKFPDSQVYPYGIYKAGWTYYNLRDAKAGLKELEDVIRYGRFVREQNIDARLDLRKEALMDMTLFYEDVSPAKEAYSYFKEQAGELDAAPPLLRLSELYKRHSRHQDIKVVLSDFVKHLPKSDYVPMAFVELMDASEKLKKRRDVVTLLEQFNNVCEPSSTWSKAQLPSLVVSKENPIAQFNENNDPKMTPSALCSRLFTKQALGYANKWLKMWQKSQDQVDLADATERAFALYLTVDPVSEDSNKARFVYAELLFNRKKFREASEQYAISGRQTKEKTIGHDARYFALIALEKAVGDKWSDRDEKTFRILSKEYLTKNPDGKYTLDVEYKGAFIAYQKGRYDEAGPIFLRLGNKYASTDKGLKSQDLYLDVLNLKKDYVTLRDYSVDLRSKTKDKERKEKLTKIYEEAYFFIAQGIEQKGKYKEAAAEYTRFAQLNPHSRLTQSALWNAMQLMFKTGDFMAGASAALAYNDRYEGTKEGLDALTKAAQTYESLGQLREAADVVLKIAARDVNQKIKWTMMAADFYTLSAEYKKARPIYQAMRRGTDSQTSYRALEQLELIARYENNAKDREGFLKEIIAAGREPQASLAGVYFVERAYNEKRFDEAFTQAKKLIAAENKGAAKSALARARLVQARILNNEFKAQSVKAQLEKIQVVLTLKTEKLGRAQLAYQGAAHYGDPVIAVQAYRELADSYLHYSEAIRSMPMPKGIPEAEADAFRAEMEKLAIPMEEKGIDTKMQAYRVATELAVHDGVVTELQEELKKLNQQVVKVESIGPKLQPAPLVLPSPNGVGT